jgi:Zn finger protein HypA/HybF involved in hydrogenase expression
MGQHEGGTVRREYRGYGECTDCGAPVRRYRVGEVTFDRCPVCGAEWFVVDGTRVWDRRYHGRPMEAAVAR